MTILQLRYTNKLFEKLSHTLGLGIRTSLDKICPDSKSLKGGSRI